MVINGHLKKRKSRQTYVIPSPNILSACNFIQLWGFPKSLVACSFSNPKSSLFQVIIQSFLESVSTLAPTIYFKNELHRSAICCVKNQLSWLHLMPLSSWNERDGKKGHSHPSLPRRFLFCTLVPNSSKSALFSSLFTLTPVS